MQALWQLVSDPRLQQVIRMLEERIAKLEAEKKGG